MHPGRICRKFKFRQALIEAFFNIIGTIGSVRSYSEPNFPFQRIISKMANLWCPLAPLLGEIRTCAHQGFYLWNLILYNFCLTRFSVQSLLFAAFSPKVSQLSHSSTSYFKNRNLWRPLAPLPGDIENCIRGVFCRKFHSEQFLFEAFFDIFGIFCSILPYCKCMVHSHSHSNALKYFKNGHLWRSLAPL